MSMLYYELCQNVWGGSPATEQINGGIDTVELVPDVDMFSSTNISDRCSSRNAKLQDGSQVVDEIADRNANSYSEGS